MQKDFIDGALGSSYAKAIVNNVCEKIKNYDGIVLLTEDTHNESDYLNTLEGKLLPVPHCLMDNNGEELPGHKLDPDVVASVKENLLNLNGNIDSLKLRPGTVFRKSTFGSLNLATTIGLINRPDNPIEEIEICGLCTDICVVSNALLIRAALPNIPMKVDSNCCAGTSKENHDAALKVMKSCQIEIV